MRLRSFGIVLLVSGFATSAFAADRAIQNGIDVWSTAGDGHVTAASMARTRSIIRTSAPMRSSRRIRTRIQSRRSCPTPAALT